MTAVTLLADPVLQADIMMQRSMKPSLTESAADWMIYTSLPRTESLISHRLSPEENLVRIRSPGAIPRLLQTLSTSSGWEFPPRMTMFLTIAIKESEKEWKGIENVVTESTEI